MRILIAGCGDVGAALGVELATGGHEVWGLRRDPAGLPAAIRPLHADLTRPATLIGLPRAIDIVVYTAAPDESTDRAYRATYVEGLCALLQAVAAQTPAPHRIVFTSSTAVYGQTDGSVPPSSYLHTRASSCAMRSHTGVRGGHDASGPLCLMTASVSFVAISMTDMVAPTRCAPENTQRQLS
jgi:nucleoside-diphosphate-sugar epimerase